MDPLAAALETLKLDDKKNISAAAKTHGVNRITLSRRFRGLTQSALEKHQNQGLLSRLQETRLISYLNTLSERGLHPTPAIVCNLVYEITRRQPGKGWVARFVRRHSDKLVSKYINPIDSDRFKADSVKEYHLWFDGLEAKIKDYSIS